MISINPATAQIQSFYNLKKEGSFPQKGRLMVTFLHNTSTIILKYFLTVKLEGHSCSVKV